MRGVAYAGFWIRVAAAIVDGIILAIVLTAVIGVLLQLTDDPEVFAEVLALPMHALYSIGFEITSGATPGKVAVGIRVTTVNGEQPSFGVAFLRWIGYFASSFSLGIGYLMIAFRSDKRGLHDLIGGTMVVRTRS